MLCDNGSNMVKVCDDWDVVHFGCVGSVFTSLYGILCCTREAKRRCTQTRTNRLSIITSLSILAKRRVLRQTIRQTSSNPSRRRSFLTGFKIVADFRAFSRSGKNSRQAHDELAQYPGVDASTVSIFLDVRTRRNSVMTPHNSL